MNPPILSLPGFSFAVGLPLRSVEPALTSAMGIARALYHDPDILVMHEGYCPPHYGRTYLMPRGPHRGFV